MTIFERFWDWIKTGLSHLWEDEAPALAAWLDQFISNEGKVILAAASVYGPQIVDGSISISDAKDKLISDLVAQGVTDVKSLEQTVFNALRTQANAVATAQ